MPQWLLLLLLILVAYRATRLITYDTILDKPRDWLYEKGPTFLAELVHCPVCSGFWIGLATVGITWIWEPLTLPGLWFVAVPGATALMFDPPWSED